MVTIIRPKEKNDILRKAKKQRRAEGEDKSIRQEPTNRATEHGEKVKRGAEHRTDQK